MERRISISKLPRVPFTWRQNRPLRRNFRMLQSRMAQILLDNLLAPFTRTSHKWLHSGWQDESTKMQNYHLSLIGSHCNNRSNIHHLGSSWCYWKKLRPWRSHHSDLFNSSTRLDIRPYSTTKIVCVGEAIWNGRKLVRILLDNMLLYPMFAWTNGCIHKKKIHGKRWCWHNCIILLTLIYWHFWIVLY